MKKHPIDKNLEICERNDVRIPGTVDPSVGNNPVRLAVNVESTDNRVNSGRSGEDPEMVKNESRDVNPTEESLRFAPPTS